MPVSMEEVRAAIDPDEVDYPAAATLGPDALPHLSTLIAGDDVGLAAKAAYLAGLINAGDSADVVVQAAGHADVRVRAAAASTAANLSGDADTERVIANLVSDADAGVQKLALKSVPARPSAELRSRLQQVSTDSPHESLRTIAGNLAQGAGAGA